MDEILKAIAYHTLDDIKSALFIQPHPDDNEIGAGGTMIKLVQKGIPVYGLTVTEGRGGSYVYSPEELSKIQVHSRGFRKGKADAPHLHRQLTSPKGVMFLRRTPRRSRNCPICLLSDRLKAPEQIRRIP